MTPQEEPERGMDEALAELARLRKAREERSKNFVHRSEFERAKARISDGVKVRVSVLLNTLRSDPSVDLETAVAVFNSEIEKMCKAEINAIKPGLPRKSQSL